MYRKKQNLEKVAVLIFKWWNYSSFCISSCFSAFLNFYKNVVIRVALSRLHIATVVSSDSSSMDLPCPGLCTVYTLAV